MAVRTAVSGQVSRLRPTAGCAHERSDQEPEDGAGQQKDEMEDHAPTTIASSYRPNELVKVLGGRGPPLIELVDPFGQPLDRSR